MAQLSAFIPQHHYWVCHACPILHWLKRYKDDLSHKAIKNQQYLLVNTQHLPLKLHLADAFFITAFDVHLFKDFSQRCTTATSCYPHLCNSNNDMCTLFSHVQIYILLVVPSHIFQQMDTFPLQLTVHGPSPFATACSWALWP